MSAVSGIDCFSMVVCTQMVTSMGWSFNPNYSVEVKEDINVTIIKKFYRQLFKDPINHDLIERFFEPTPTNLVLALFFKEHMIKATRCIISERIRKEDMEYENKVQLVEGAEAKGVDITEHERNVE